MRPGIHPEYRDIVFHDTTSDTYFVVGSTAETSRTVEYNGKTYPYMTIEVSSKSHPFYTGEQRVTQSDGRVARFNRRFKKGVVK